MYFSKYCTPAALPLYRGDTRNGQNRYGDNTSFARFGYRLRKIVLMKPGQTIKNYLRLAFRRHE